MAPPPVTVTMRIVALPASATIGEMARLASVESSQIIVELMNRGVLATINAAIDRDTARAILAKFDVEVVAEEAARAGPDGRGADAVAAEEAPPVEPEARGDPRPPVVTVMGHVDHGKTTLLDAIRETKVVDGEYGGITQHIGAYQVQTSHGPITFIDTPGHEAFTAMRAQGAGVTDIAVVVAAADDGVMPQTVEAIGHARAAGVPIIIAVNKIDLPGANPDRVLQQLTEHEIVVESYGGPVVSVEVSALQGQGIDDLLEYIALTAQLEDLRAPSAGQAQATVIETRMDRSQGPVATLIIRSGALAVGDTVAAGGVNGRVRALFDDAGRRLTSAGPSSPVEVMGLEDLPNAGERLLVVEQSRGKRRARRAPTPAPTSEPAMRLSLEQLAAQMTTGQFHQINVVVRADTAGAARAVVTSVEDLGDARSRAAVVFEGVGAITESDVNLAAAAQGIVVGFEVRAEPNARAAAERQGVDIRLYRTIYDLIDEISAALAGLIEPEDVEVIDGQLEIRGEFRSERNLQIVGGMVLSGRIVQGGSVRIFRNGELIGSGRVASLRRFADAVEEVREGFDCGLGVETTAPIQLADVIEGFHTESRRP